MPYLRHPYVLRPHQESIIGELVLRVRRDGGTILADEMGLGKTLTSLVVSHECNSGVGYVLVIAPLCGISTWRGEIEGKIEGGLVIEMGSKEEGYIGTRSGGYILVTYDRLCSIYEKRRDFFDALMKYIKFMIVDEAHYIRNPRTRRYGVVRSIPDGIPRLVMTGTLLCNRLEDVCSLASIAIPTKPYGEIKFLREHLGEFRAEHVIMRKKSEVSGLGLPECTVERIIRPMTEWESVAYHGYLAGPVRQAYERLMCVLSTGDPVAIRRAFDVYNGSIRVLGMMTLHPELGLLTEAKKRGLDPESIYEYLIGCASTKMGLIMGALVAVVTSGGGKVVVASSSVVFLELLAYWGRRYHGIRGSIYDGTKTSKQRSTILGMYKGGSLDVLYVSTGACSVSVDLVGAGHMIICDTCLNPSMELQMIGRCHRMGMTCALRVYRVEMARTLDEVLVDTVHACKKNNMKAIESGGVGYGLVDLRGIYPLLNVN